MSEDEKYEQLRQGCVSYRNDYEKLEKEIADLEAKLAEKESELVLARNTSINTNKMEILHLQIENEELKQQLAEKDKLLIEKIGNMKSNEFIKMCIDCGFMVDAKEKHNQDKIELLEKVKHDLVEDMRLATDKLKSAIYIDTLIKEIKGE